MRTLDKFRIGSKILASRISGKPRPFFVQYSMLNGCNAKCTYCNSPLREDPQLDTATHKKLLSDFARLGTVRIKFLGGEPLIRPDIDELVSEVGRLGMRSAMVTNGFLIPKKIETVRKLDELIISIDGSEHVHDRQRGKGSWKKVMAGIDACVEERIDFFLSAVVTKHSINEIDWLLDLARRIGVMANFQIPQTNVELYGAEAQEWIPSADEIKAIIRKIKAEKEAGAPVLFSTQSYQRTLDWTDYTQERIVDRGKVSPCSAGRYFIQMEPNGDIYPCVLHVGSFEPKNAVKDGVEDSWRHAQDHSCVDCFNTWLNENKAIFSLKPSVLFNFYQNYMRPRITSPLSRK